MWGEKEGKCKVGRMKASEQVRRCSAFIPRDLGMQRRLRGCEQRAGLRMESDKHQHLFITFYVLESRMNHVTFSVAPARFCVSECVCVLFTDFRHEGRSSPLDLSVPQHGTTHTPTCKRAHTVAKKDGRIQAKKDDCPQCFILFNPSVND